MPNNAAFEVIEDYKEENEDSLDDFEFVIGPDGELKSMVIPEHLMEDPPEEIQLILKLYGIDDINTLDDRTLH
jgi:hypothetical protein